MMFNHCFKVRSLILAAALISGFGLVTHATAQERSSFLVDINTKTVTPIGTLDGGHSLAYGINDVGQVVGESSLTPGGNYHAFITGPDGAGITDLNSLVDLSDGVVLTAAHAINDSGQVAGSFTTREGEQHIFITDLNGGNIRDLGLGGPSDINAAGQVVGYSGINRGIPGDIHAFITDPNGMDLRNLSLGGDFNSSAAAGVNDAGQVVGWARRVEGDHTFLTGPNGMGITDLGTFGGYGYPNDINTTGQVVGLFGTAGDIHAYITDPNGIGITDLGTLGGGYSQANGINDVGQVVGVSDTRVDGVRVGQTLAFITGPDGMGMMDLNSLVDLPQGVILTEAVGINNAGQVIAVGVIPEPEVSALLLAGLALIGFMTGRKRENSVT